MWGVSVRPAACSPSMPRGVATVHRHTANSAIVTRRKAPSSQGKQLHRHTASNHASIHASIQPSIHLRCHRRSLARVHCCCWRPADYIVTRLRTISSHGCGQYRHTLWTYIVTRRYMLRTYIVTRCGHISSHGAKPYKKTYFRSKLP